jgi:hypothetical protein
MSGATPLLPLYTFMAWKRKIYLYIRPIGQSLAGNKESYVLVTKFGNFNV